MIAYLQPQNWLMLLLQPQNWQAIRAMVHQAKFLFQMGMAHLIGKMQAALLPLKEVAVQALITVLAAPGVNPDNLIIRKTSHLTAMIISMSLMVIMRVFRCLLLQEITVTVLIQALMAYYIPRASRLTAMTMSMLPEASTYVCLQRKGISVIALAVLALRMESFLLRRASQ
jgi:hypothetical protein